MNTLALLNMYREKGVAAVRTPAGVRFMGTRNIARQQLEMLNRIPQHELEAVLRWQKA
ncbi:hypothetical protein MJN71_20730 [Salmonella enterica subsp. enterica serovar Cerro]|nr:hypothetical protein [Salmonella enterica subsp. enterica serovar Cerro]MEB8545744.1 hypothetical protein [Salmonella enterica subsp. enterica serovar Cerro]